MRARQRRMMNRKVLVLNSSYEVLTFITWERAITHVVTGVAQILDSDPEVRLRSAGDVDLPYPVSIIMKNYVHVDWSKSSNVSEELAAKSAILSRDGYMCMYCGEPGSTIDHIIPKAQGGRDTWTNLCVACAPCNSYKANRTPEEAGMSLIREPFKPESTSRREKAQKEIYRRLESGDIVFEEEYYAGDDSDDT